MRSNLRATRSQVFQLNLGSQSKQVSLSEQYQVLIGLNQVLKMGWDIVQNDSTTAVNRLQAIALLNDKYKYVMDLTTTNGLVVTDAIKYVQGQMDHLPSQEKKLLKEIKHKEERRELKNVSGRR